VGTWFGIGPVVLRFQYKLEASLPIDLCVHVVHWLSLCGEIKSVYLHVV